MASLGESIIRAQTIDEAIKILDRAEAVHDVEAIHRLLDSLKRSKLLPQDDLVTVQRMVERWREKLYNGR